MKLTVLTSEGKAILVMLIVIALLILSCFATTSVRSQSPSSDQRSSTHLDLPNSDRTNDDEEEDLPEVIRFFENPYEGECFVFCCDRSGSMSWTYQGRQKFQWLKEELIRAINQMSSAAEYSMVIFDAGMLIFAETPVTADPAGRQRGIGWVMALSTGHGTCLAPAGVKAVQVATRSTKQHRTVIILGDGIPTCNGQRTQAQCLRDITAANVQRYPIHTVFIPDDGDWEDPDFLRQLAQMNNGTFKMVGQ